MDTSDSMNRFLAYHRRILGVMTGLSLAAAAFILAVTRPAFDWTGGFLAGSAAQLLKFAIIDVNIVKKIALLREKAATIQLKGSLLSLALFGLAVAVVFIFKLNVWAMAAGIFLPRIVLLADSYLRPNPFGPATPDVAATPLKESADE